MKCEKMSLSTGEGPRLFKHRDTITTMRLLCFLLWSLCVSLVLGFPLVWFNNPYMLSNFDSATVCSKYQLTLQFRI